MKKKFDFKDVGKRTPYEVKDGFFDDVTRRTVERACREAAGKSIPEDSLLFGEERRSVVHVRRGWSLTRRVVSIAACAACLAAVVYVANNNGGKNPTMTAYHVPKTVEEVFATMSDEEISAVAALAVTEQMYEVY